MGNLMSLMRQLQGSSIQSLEPDAWQELLLMLLVRLKVRMRRFSLEETFNSHMILLICRVLLKAMHEFQPDELSADSILDAAGVEQDKLRRRLRKVLGLLQVDTSGNAEFPEGFMESVALSFVYHAVDSIHSGYLAQDPAPIELPLAGTGPNFWQSGLELQGAGSSTVMHSNGNRTSSQLQPCGLPFVPSHHVEQLAFGARSTSAAGSADRPAQLVQSNSGGIDAPMLEEMASREETFAHVLQHLH